MFFQKVNWFAFSKMELEVMAMIVNLGNGDNDE